MVERTDIELTTDLGTELTDGGDFKTVTAKQETHHQRAVAQALNMSVPWRGSRMTAPSVEEFRDRLQRRLARDDVLDSQATVSIDSIDGGTVTYDVTVGDVSLFFEPRRRP